MLSRAISAAAACISRNGACTAGESSVILLHPPRPFCLLQVRLPLLIAGVSIGRERGACAVGESSVILLHPPSRCSRRLNRDGVAA